MFVLDRAHRLKLGNHMLQEEQRTIVHTRQSGTEATIVATLVMLCLYFLLLLLPVHAERWIRKEIVERFAFELILGKTIAETNVAATAVVAHFLHQHVGRGGSECALVVVLPVNIEFRPRVVFA